MFGWDEAQNARDEVYNQNGGYENPNHEAKFSHELIAGAASFEAFHLLEKKQREEGKVVNHAFAKELLAGFVGGEVDKLVETKGMDAYDRERAHHRAQEGAREMYDQHYGGQEQYDPNSYGPPPQIDNYYNNNN